jgi:hypothetical protein
MSGLDFEGSDFNLGTDALDIQPEPDPDLAGRVVILIEQHDLAPGDAHRVDDAEDEHRALHAHKRRRIRRQ